MARAPVREIPLSAQLRPVATPVDTFVRPAQSPLRGLADALGTFDRSLQQFLSVRDEKAMRDDEVRGRAAFYEDSSGEFARAVTEGKIPAHYSPSYVRGFKNAQGAAAGEKLRTKWQDAWDNWDGKDSEDPESFNVFFSEFIKNNVGTDDPDVLRGVLPQVEALQANATTQYTQYRHDRTVQGNLDAHGAVISSTVQNGVDDGLVSDTGTNYEAIFGNVDKVISESLAKGDPGGKAVDTFIDVMSAKILETRDPKLLDWFDRKVPGKEYTYGDSPYGLKVKNATINGLETLAREQAAGMSKAERDEQERLKDQAQAAIIDSLIADPNAPIDQKLIDQAKKNGDPTIEIRSREWRKTISEGVTDPQKLAQWYDDVASGRMTPKKALQTGLINGVFGTAEDIRSAASFVQSFETSEDTITTTLNGQVARQVQEVIRQRTVGVDPTTLNPLAGTSDEGLEATADFRQLVTRWIINNPNATLPEIEEQVTKFGKMITDRFQAPADPFTEGARYERDPALEFQNPYSTPPAQSEQVSPEAQPTGEQPAAPTPEEEEQARRRGMGVEEYRRWLQEQNPQNGAGEGIQPSPISYNPDDPDLGEGDASGNGLTPQIAEQLIDQAFEQSIASELTPGDQEASLLSLIRKHEARGNYNAVFGNANSDFDLSQLTVDEILAQQQEARKRGAKSTAIGAYQFIYKTLRGLKAEMGLTGNEKFTPELQDKMGVALLNRRGLQSFRAGRISKKQFALSLSQEWAALPNPNTGRSFYAGDGLNRSLVSTQKVYAALGFIPSDPNPAPAGDPYANIPDVDGNGQAGQRDKFLQWNPDPVGNHEANLNSIDPTLADVVRRAQLYSPVQIVVGSGKRDADLQQKAMEWGWSKTNESDHLHGGAVDLWPVDENGAVNFDEAAQQNIVDAMKRAAAELGVELDVGADWKKFKDKPHFALKNTKA